MKKLIIVYILLVASSIWLGYNIRAYDDTIYTCNQQAVYFEEHKNASGYYNYNKGFYCVKTAGRNRAQIETTENHEICHYLVDIDYQHFCTLNISSKEYQNYEIRRIK